MFVVILIQSSSWLDAVNYPSYISCIEAHVFHKHLITNGLPLGIDTVSNNVVIVFRTINI